MRIFNSPTRVGAVRFAIEELPHPAASPGYHLFLPGEVAGRQDHRLSRIEADGELGTDADRPACAMVDQGDLERRAVRPIHEEMIGRALELLGRHLARDAVLAAVPGCRKSVQ